jgi:hypothetical protein
MKPKKRADLSEAKRRYIREGFAHRLAGHPETELDERLSELETSELEIDNTLVYIQSFIAWDRKRLDKSRKQARKHFRALRIVTVFAFLTIVVGIAALFSLEDSFTFDLNHETALIVLTVVLSSITFLLLSILIWIVVRSEDTSQAPSGAL